jgi:S-disulfanyl-L-cysteine oxidoreductase SoxD
MTLKYFIVTLIAMLMAGVVTRMGAVQPKSQWDGIYLQEQAKRGGAVYSAQCATCHGQDLRGGDMAPGLIGEEFFVNWYDLTISDLFERIRISMPQNSPGSLSRQETADVVSFILSKSNFPAGESELSSELAVLKAIAFIAKKPAAQ